MRDEEILLEHRALKRKKGKRKTFVKKAPFRMGLTASTS